MTSQSRPRIAVIPGDPSGIGPEPVARLLAQDCATDADILPVGDLHGLELVQSQAHIPHAMTEIDAKAQDSTQIPCLALHPMHTITPSGIAIATSTDASGSGGPAQPAAGTLASLPGCAEDHIAQVKPALPGNCDGSQFNIENAAKELAYARDLLETIDPSCTKPTAALALRLADLVARGQGDAYVSTQLCPDSKS